VQRIKSLLVILGKTINIIISYIRKNYKYRKSCIQLLIWWF